MDEQTIILGISIAYLALMLGIGVWANRRMASAREFLVAGQSLGFFVMAMASFSSIQSGWGMVGATGTTATWGIGAFVAAALLPPLGFTLAWFLLGGRLRTIAQRHEVYSIPDIVRVRYRSRAAHLSMSVAMIVGAIGYMTAQVVAAGVIMSLLLGLPLGTATVLGALVVAAYTIAGGMLAAVWTDLVQGILMIAMSIVVFVVALGVGGGWSSTMATLTAADPDLLALDGVKTAAWIGANSIMILLGVVAQPQLIHKFLMLRSPRELKWGATVAAIGYATTTLFSLGVGLGTRAAIADGRMAEPGVVDDTATSFLGTFTSPLVAGLALTALLAAIMSSASSFITIGASALTRDLMASLGLRIGRELFWNRVASLAVVAASLYVGLYLDQIIYLLGAIGWAAFAAAIFGPVVLGIYWRRGTSLATTVSVVVGLGLNVALTLLTSAGWTPPPTFFSGGVVVCSGILVYIGVSVCTRSAGDRERFDGLYPATAPPGHARAASISRPST